MIVEILAADAVSMCVCVVSPAQDACIWDVHRKEIVEPMNAVCCRPGLVAVSVQSVDSHDTEMKSEQAYTRIRNGILYNGPLSFRHHLETLE